MITKLIGAATLFAAGSLVAGAPAALGTTPVDPFGAEAALSSAANCGAKDAKDEGKAPAKAKDGSCGSKNAKAKKGAKEGSCGKGTCGSKDPKKDAPADKK